jgi:hypothetical protein
LFHNQLYFNVLARLSVWRGGCNKVTDTSQKEHVMSRTSSHPIRLCVCFTALLMWVASAAAFAQDQSPTQTPPPAEAGGAAPTAGWHRFSSPPQNPATVQTNIASTANSNDSAPPAGQAGAPEGAPTSPQDNSQAQPVQAIPAQLTLKQDTLLTVRVNQYLSSDRNQAGDTFSGTLVQPVVVDGVVVAERGQTVAGRVADAQKAGRVKGVSRLALQLTRLTLVDGDPLAIQTQLTGHRGPTSNGRDAAAMAATTGVGAAIGASAADWGSAGEGAAIGAGAGAVAGLVGVLLTRGRPTEVYPETVLTFEVAAPTTIATTRAPQAFRYVDSSDYAPQQTAQAPPREPRPCAGYGCAPSPYWYGPAYAYWPYWEPGFTFWVGPRFYYGRGFYGRGFYRGGFRR